MRVVFFGTPEAAVPILDSLVANHEVVAVVTAPDRPRGRRLQLTPSPVKQAATQAGIEIFQPLNLRGGLSRLSRPSGFGPLPPPKTIEYGGERTRSLPDDLPADVFVVAAYGMILPPRVLSIPPRGCLNVHFSLLPKLRGAAPVQWALIQGLDHTGVTIMQMDKGLDTGPILTQAQEPITPGDTAGTLEMRLAHTGAALLLETLEAVEAGTTTATPQDDAQATLAPSLETADARIDWNQTAVEISNRVRAFNPRPGAWTMLGNKRIKIHRATASFQTRLSGPPGKIEIGVDEMLVVCEGGVLIIEELQTEGKGRLAASDFLKGARLQSGECFQ